MPTYTEEQSVRFLCQAAAAPEPYTLVGTVLPLYMFHCWGRVMRACNGGWRWDMRGWFEKPAQLELRFKEGSI